MDSMLEHSVADRLVEKPGSGAIPPFELLELGLETAVLYRGVYRSANGLKIEGVSCEQRRA